MAGLLLIGILVTWLAAAALIAVWIASRVPSAGWRFVLDLPTRTVRAWIPILDQDISWVDSQSGDLLISYKAYEAKGGWLIRALGIRTATRSEILSDF